MPSNQTSIPRSTQYYRENRDKVNSKAKLEYAKDGTKQKQYAKNYRDRRAELIKEAKARPCADCDIQYGYWVMQFDHRPDTTKKANVGDMRSYSIKTILEEIEKCDVVCANCHFERSYTHWMERSF